jgi:hypothetical protein
MGIHTVLIPGVGGLERVCMPYLEMSHYLGPKNALTDEQVVVINRIRGKFLALANEVAQEVHANPARDKAFDLLLEAVEQVELAVQRPSCLTRDILSIAFVNKNRMDKKVTDIWVNAYNCADLRKLCHDIFEHEADSSALVQGIQGKIWGATVHTSRLIPQQTFVIVAEGEENLTRDQAPSEFQLTRF